MRRFPWTLIVANAAAILVIAAFSLVSLMYLSLEHMYITIGTALLFMFIFNYLLRKNINNFFTSALFAVLLSIFHYPPFVYALVITYFLGSGSLCCGLNSFESFVVNYLYVLIVITIVFMPIFWVARRGRGRQT